MVGALVLSQQIKRLSFGIWRGAKLSTRLTMEGLPEWPIDKELIDAATSSLQAHENVSALIRKKLVDNPLASNAIDSTNTILDNLRHLKSGIEGTSFTFRPITINHDHLAILRHLVVAHVPNTLHYNTKRKIEQNVTDLLKGQVKRVIYSCIITCPWFAAAQTEISTGAKNNMLFVVYVANDEHFFSLATPHEKELCETIDSPPIFACEIRHLLSQALKGNVKCIEALCSPPEAVITRTSEWDQLLQLLDPVRLLSRTFIDRCVGQSFGALVQKNQHKGKWVVRDDASLTKFSDSFRLLKYAESAIQKRPIDVWRQINIDCNEGEKEILLSLQQAFDGLIHKEKLLQLVLDLKDTIEKQTNDIKRETPYWSDQLGAWLTTVRLDGVKLSPTIDPATSIAANLRSLLDSEGLTKVAARDVIVVARAGSQMYNLSLPTSDTDYIIIYKEPTEQLISRCTSLKESVSTRGQQANIESASYEIRLFCEMLLKGAVNMFELLFADNMEYSSPYWNLLVPHKHSFMSEKVILQYIGFVKTHRKLIDSKKHTGTARERKLFYQVFHKLLSLESYVNGGAPIVKCIDESREFILRVRRGPLEGWASLVPADHVLCTERPFGCADSTLPKSFSPIKTFKLCDVESCLGVSKQYLIATSVGSINFEDFLEKTKGELDREVLISQAEERLQKVKDHLLLRKERYREFGDYRILQTWLLHVRGITLKEPLKMVTPPLLSS